MYLAWFMYNLICPVTNLEVSETTGCWENCNIRFMFIWQGFISSSTLGWSFVKINTTREIWPKNWPSFRICWSFLVRILSHSMNYNELWIIVISLKDWRMLPRVQNHTKWCSVCYYLALYFGLLWIVHPRFRDEFHTYFWRITNEGHLVNFHVRHSLHALLAALLHCRCCLWSDHISTRI